MKDNLINKAINWAKRKGFSEIKAQKEEFETPKSYSKAGSESVYTPDVTAEKNGSKSYFEIALKTDNPQAVISKWKLFYTLAENRGGQLYLLVSRGHKSFTEKIVKDYHLTNAKMIGI